MATSFAEIVERVRELDTGSKQELMELIRAWLLEERRQEILQNACLAGAEVSQGRARHGTVDDLMADLYAKD